MLYRTLVAVAVLALPSVASAQQVTFLGQVEDVSGQQNQFFVDCTNTQLTSALDLNPFVGQQTQITGQWNGSFISPSVDVTSITIVPETFEVGGNGDLGGELTFGVTHTPGSFTIMYASFGVGFAPLPSGVWFLDFSTMLRVTSGTIPGVGNLERKVNVPNDPALQDVTVYGQALIVEPGGNALLANSDCKTLGD